MNKQPIGLISFILLIILYSKNFAQPRANYCFSFSARYGFIFPHRPSIAYLVQRHIPAFDITVSKQLNHNTWHTLYKFPYTGIGLYHANLGNPQYTGKAYAIYGFFDIPLILKNNYSFNFKYSLGIAYLTKNYHYAENYYNLVIGSPFNAYVDFGLTNSFVVKPLRISFGITYTHYSNGAITKPNLGFNIPSLSVSLGYINNYTPFKKDSLMPDKKRHFEIHLLAATGVRQNSTSDPYRYIANTISLNLEKYFSAKRMLGIGFDFFYDPSIPQRYNFSYEKPYIPYYRYGIHLSHDWVFDKFSVTFHTGRYLFDPYLLDGWIYSRVGIKYKINSFLQANILLKSHFAKADIIEFGVSYYTTKHQVFRKQNN